MFWSKKLFGIKKVEHGQIIIVPKNARVFCISKNIVSFVKEKDELILIKDVDLKYLNDQKMSTLHNVSLSFPHEIFFTFGIYIEILIGKKFFASDANKIFLEVPMPTNSYWFSPKLKAQEQAYKELETTGTIQGFEVLNLKTLEKCWVSHYDVKYLLDNQSNS